MERAARLGRQIRWYVSSMMGDNHYERYLAHHRRTHPDQPVLTEAEYWRNRHLRAEADPGARCC